MLTKQSKYYFGSSYILPKLIKRHLFISESNNSATTYIKNLLETSSSTWNLKREGQATEGFDGPKTRGHDYHLIWAAKDKWLNNFRNPCSFNWDKTKIAWYRQAYANNFEATVFVEKSPSSLAYRQQLEDNFLNPSFIYILRNPHAIAEGIHRNLQYPSSIEERFQLIAKHISQCFHLVSTNLHNSRDNTLLIEYELFCENPGLYLDQITTLFPEINDLNIDQPIAVKGKYYDVLHNMNGNQLERLSSDQINYLNKEFIKHRQLFEKFGYQLP